MKFNVIGVMSGTSLDGLDLALCRFEKKEKWTFEILKATTLCYYNLLKSKLKESLQLSAIEYITLHKDYGEFIGNSIKDFANSNEYNFVASHGHTSIHFPQQNLNFQLGNGASIAAKIHKPVICDFRSLDIALNGQGAPLVPIGDKLLFKGYDAFLNIGGFANISFPKHNKVLAYDICSANFALNYLSKKLGLEYDRNGEIGRNSTKNESLLDVLQNIKYYGQNPPKSLSDHWFYREFLTIIDSFEISIESKIATVYEHISNQIANELDKNNVEKVLVTGGGAHNTHLIRRIMHKTKADVIVPEKTIVDYKEALVFAFLGVLRWIKEPNCLASVTGAEIDNVGGAVHYVNHK